MEGMILCSLEELKERREEDFEKDGIQCRALRNESAISDWIDCTLLCERAWIEKRCLGIFLEFLFHLLIPGDFSPHKLTYQHIIPGVFGTGMETKSSRLLVIFERLGCGLRVVWHILPAHILDSPLSGWWKAVWIVDLDMRIYYFINILLGIGYGEDDCI
jgi:hypothetical protein